ncbi:MAG: hypothetical protein SNJ78_00890 [Spirochaetales bacterium]
MKYPLQDSSDEMLTILDALESITNGMEQPGLQEKLQQIPPSSPLRPYVDLIFAIQAYYKGEVKAVSHYLLSIPDSSPPARLKPLLFYLCHLTDIPPEGKVEKELVKALQYHKSVLETTAEEALTSLQAGIEEAFSDSMAYLIRELYVKQPTLAQKTTLWVLQQMHLQGWEGSLFKQHLKMIVGELECLRLQALHAFYHAPSEGFTFWYRYIIRLLQNGNREEQEIEAALLVGLYAGILSTLHPNEVEVLEHQLDKDFPALQKKYKKFFLSLSNRPLPISSLPTYRKSSKQLELF